MECLRYASKETDTQTDTYIVHAHHNKGKKVADTRLPSVGFRS